MTGIYGLLLLFFLAGLGWATASSYKDKFEAVLEENNDLRKRLGR